MRSTSIIFLLLFASYACGVAQADSISKVPLEYFAQLPDVADMALSPDGKKVASLTRVDIPEQKGTSVMVTDLKSGKSKILLFSDNSEYVIYNIYWKDNVTLLAHGFSPQKLKYHGSTNVHHYKTRVNRLLFVNSETGEVTNPFTSMFLSQFNTPPSVLDDVIDILRDDPDHVLLGVYGNIYIVDIHNGTAKIYGEQPDVFSPRYVDRQHRLRVGFYHDVGKDNLTVKYLDLKDNEWKDLTTFESNISKGDVDILGFDQDPNILYIRTYHNDRMAIFKVDLSQPELKKELLVGDDKYDIGGNLAYSRKQNKLVGFLGESTEQTRVFDDHLKSVQSKIDKAMPNTSNRMYSFSEDLDKFLLYSSGPTESGTYYLVSTSPVKVNAIAYRYKNLAPDILNPVKKLSYKARDGLNIEAFLTLPNGRKHKNLPAIMLPHGGPIARDTDAFDYWAQFFASRGYAVLQMNYRGSWGYGHSLMKAGFGKWGKEMQDDIEDGARYLIKEGIADKNRIAIVGASYGGYAALMGAVKTPDFYQCAISVAGVADLKKFMQEQFMAWDKDNIVADEVGFAYSKVKKYSPYHNAKKIQIPVLLVHGELDQQVEVDHSKYMYKALKHLKQDVEYVELPNEDHYLSYEDNRIKTFKSMIAFLDKHMPAHLAKN